MSFQNMIGGLDVMFTSDDRRSDIPFLNHLKLHVDVVPGSVRVWTHLMRFLDQGIGGGGGYPRKRYSETDDKAKTAL